MLRIAVTGGIACGKSLAGSFLERQGVSVCDADTLAHSAMAPGGAAFERVRRYFGPGILGPDGCVDRAALGRRVFSNAAERNALDSMVHPIVVGAWTEWLGQQEKRCRAAAVMVPLLFEAGQGAGWDAVICVYAGRATLRRRLADRGLTEAEASARIAAQWPVERKMELSDYVVCNEGTPERLQRQLDLVMESLVEMRLCH